jgi:DNA-binding NtrC family response regulator
VGTRRILFIDDDELILSSLTRHFDRLGYQTFTATSGREGIKAFNRVSPDVTVLDLQMPGISGLHVLEEIRSKHPMVIMLTGHGVIENAVEAMRRGAENFLTKPIQMSHLAQVVEKAAEKAEIYRVNRQLRERLAPSFQRRAAQSVMFLLLVAVAIAVGVLIGSGSRTAVQTAPIPVPFDPQDTAIVREETPFRPGVPPGVPPETPERRR